MKNLLRFTFLFLIAASITSCDQDHASDLIKSEDATLYRLTMHDGELSMEPVTIEAFTEYTKTIIHTRGGNNSSTNGLFNAGPTMGTFSAMENNSGVHGNSHLTGDGFFLDIRVNSDCIVVIDNIAFGGGECTKWVVADPDAFPIGVGGTLVYSAKDNGEGNNNDPDEVGEAYIVAPPGFVPSDFGLPFDTWCEFAVADYDYDWGGHGHDYFPGDDPTNIQVQ